MVEVRSLRNLDEHQAAADLFRDVWGSAPVERALLVALDRSGCYVSGAFDESGLVGAAVAWRGSVGGVPLLHSHLAATRPDRRRTGAGAALKWHQRGWCLGRGIELVTWTFDPLVRRNAAFNLRALGAVGAAYEVDAYGAMEDGINRGDPSDRLLARWALRDERVERAAAGTPVVPAARGAQPAIEVTAGGVPHAVATIAAVRLVATPPDVEALRVDEPALARRWRTVVRAAMQDAFASGLRAVAVTDQGDYVMASMP